MAFLRTRITVCLLAAALSLSAADWPAYKADGHRSGAVEEPLPLPLTAAWTFTPQQAPCPAWPDPFRHPTDVDIAYRGDAAQPVICDFDYAFEPIVSDGLVIFGSSADDSVRALALSSGQEQWRFVTGGPIRFAPHAADGHVYVASDDGFVYCLTTAGRLHWRFRAAPGADLLPGNGRMISRWPLRSGVLVDDGTVYVTAGMWPAEGIFVYALDAATGKVLWRNDTSGALNHPAVSGGAYAITGVAPQGYLLATTDELIVPTGRSMPARFSRRNGHLTAYLQTGYQHKFGGVWATLDESESSLFCGYPEPRLKSGRDVDSSFLFQNQRFSRKLKANRLLVSRGDIYRVYAEQVFAEKAVADRPRLWTAPFPDGRAFAMAAAADILFVGGEQRVSAYARDTGALCWQSPPLTDEVRGLALAGGHLLAASADGLIHCFASGGEEPSAVGPATTAAETPAPSGWVAELLPALQQAGVRRGYAVVLGDRDARQAAALAAASALQVTAALEQTAVAAERDRLALTTELYGSRVAVTESGSNVDLPWATFSCNLVIRLGAVDPQAAAELLRILRPAGGLLYLPSAAAPEVRTWFTAEALGELSLTALGSGTLLRRGKLAGAFDWDSEEPLDQRVQWPLELAWFGGPGPTTATQGGPLPVAANGRFIVVGRHHLMAVDAYNGTELWTRSMPYLARHVGLLPRLPGPPVSSLLRSMAADDELVYLDFGALCFALDAATGEQRAVYGSFAASAAQLLVDRLMLPLQRQAAMKPHIGSQAAIIGEGLAALPAIDAGPADDLVPADHTPTVEIERLESGLAMHLRGGAEAGRGSHYWELFFDFRPPARRGELYGPGIFQKIVNLAPPGIVAGLGPHQPAMQLRESGAELIAELRWAEVAEIPGCAAMPSSFGFMVCFNERRGGTYARWRRFGDDLAYVCNNGWASIDLAATPAASSPPVCLPLDELPPVARRWARLPPHTTSAPTRGPPDAHAADVERTDPRFSRSESYYGATPDQRTMPLTEELTPRGFARGKGCGGRIASSAMEIMRASVIGFYDFVDDSGMRYFPGVRTACRASMLPALGVLFSPEGSSYCSCSYNFKTSLALVPTNKRRQEDWALFWDRPRQAAWVRSVALNLGAPGDRRDDDGTLWLQYPRPMQRFVMQLPVRTSGPDRPQPIRVNADYTEIAGSDRPWLHASALSGLKAVTVDLIMDTGGSTSYRCGSAPVIDGQLTDPCWDGTGNFGDTEPVFARHDNQQLYLGFRRRLVPDRLGRTRTWRRQATGEDGAFFKDDTCEVYLRDARDDGKVVCLHFAVSASGARYDARWSESVVAELEPNARPKLNGFASGGATDTELDGLLVEDGVLSRTSAWHGKWTSAVNVTADQFTAELALPWDMLGAAGLRRDQTMVNVRWRGRLAGTPLETARRILASEDFEPLLPLDLPEGPRPYTVKLHFCELADIVAGARVFDVLLQGQTVASGVDVAALTGGRLRALTRTFVDIPADRRLTVQLLPRGDAGEPTALPLLNGLELIMQTP